MANPILRGTRSKHFSVGGAVFDASALTDRRVITLPDADVTLGAGGGGVTDHGALTGLADDDHAQYHNDARGDARYAPVAHVGAGSTAHANAVAAGAAGFMTGADKTKLDGIASAATANASDASLRDRATHTGTQAASTISDFSTAADARIAAASINALTDVTITGATNGQVLKYSGGVWMNDADATGGGGGGLTQSQVATLVSMRI